VAVLAGQPPSTGNPPIPPPLTQNYYPLFCAS